MPVLDHVDGLKLRPPARACAERVSRLLAETDRMYAGDAAHYLTCGASALSVIHAATVLAGKRPAALLDFGSGAGRVTRWLRAHWPQARITVSDLRAEDLAFCAEHLGCTAWTASTDLESLAPPGRYDLIWAGSVLTHLDEARSTRLIERMLSWTQPEGLVVVSLHGRLAAARGPSVGFYGVGAERWAAMQAQVAGEAAYGYADYPGASGYGVSLCRPEWSTGLLERLPQARLVLFGEQLWDAHHDVLALQRRSIDAR